MKRKLLAVSILLALASAATAQTTPPVPPPTTTTPPATTEPALGVPANRLVNLFTGFLGSRQNAIALVTALRSGTDATLTVPKPACVAPCTATPTTGGTTIVVETKPMGWGNVRHALALAQYSLAQAGITNPTPQQISAALNGGTVTTTAGKPVELRGVLTMRASGMGWGNIARAEGTTMGSVNHGLKPFNAVTTPPPTTTTASTPVAPRNIGITSAAGAPAGIVTAAGGGTSSQQPGRGIVNGNGGGASGMASGNGNGGGNGHGNGNGNGHAGGGGAGVTTAGNSAASTTVTTASNGNGRGNGNGHGNGKGK